MSNKQHDYDSQIEGNIVLVAIIFFFLHCNKPKLGFYAIMSTILLLVLIMFHSILPNGPGFCVSHGSARFFKVNLRYRKILPDNNFICKKIYKNVHANRVLAGKNFIFNSVN